MDFVIGLIAFIIMLSVIVILHELGHFLVAKHFGVYCKELVWGHAFIKNKEKKQLFQFVPFLLVAML